MVSLSRAGAGAVQRGTEPSLPLPTRQKRRRGWYPNVTVRPAVCTQNAGTVTKLPATRFDRIHKDEDRAYVGLCALAIETELGWVRMST